MRPGGRTLVESGKVHGWRRQVEAAGGAAWSRERARSKWRLGAGEQSLRAPRGSLAPRPRRVGARAGMRRRGGESAG